VSPVPFRLLLLAGTALALFAALIEFLARYMR
jgi:hypothetical protein